MAWAVRAVSLHRSGASGREAEVVVAYQSARGSASERDRGAHVSESGLRWHRSVLSLKRALNCCACLPHARKGLGAAGSHATCRHIDRPSSSLKRKRHERRSYIVCSTAERGDGKSQLPSPGSPSQDDELSEFIPVGRQGIPTKVYISHVPS